MARYPVYKITLVREGSLSHPEPREKITDPRQAYELLAAYLEGADREHFVMLLLDAQDHVIGIHTVAVGCLDAAIVHPREVFKPAILSNAASIITAHNHPSGDLLPSADDIVTTTKLVQAGELMGIPVRDHIILGDLSIGPKNCCFYSLKEEGLIPS